MRFGARVSGMRAERARWIRKAAEHEHGAREGEGSVKPVARTKRFERTKKGSGPAVAPLLHVLVGLALLYSFSAVR